MNTRRRPATLPAVSTGPAGDDSAPLEGSISRAKPKAAVPAIAANSPRELEGRRSYLETALADIVDRSLHAAIARFTGGLSPAALAHAHLDWATHLAYAPGKRLELVDEAMRQAVRLVNYVNRCAMGGGAAECCIEPLAQDKRFAGEDWQQWPFSFF